MLQSKTIRRNSGSFVHNLNFVREHYAVPCSTALFNSTIPTAVFTYISLLRKPKCFYIAWCWVFSVDPSGGEF